MSLIRFRRDPDFFPALSSFFDDPWGRDLARSVATGTTIPAVNISEDNQNFQVDVAAPGLKKEDFKVKLDHNVLSISAEHKEEKETSEGADKNKTMTRREYSFASFQRSFSVPETVQADKIVAQYKDGVLHLTLPKREEAKRLSSQEIAVN